MQDPRSDIQLIACLTEAELFNGSTILRAIQPGHTPSLLEAQGIAEETHPDQHADEYCAIIDIHLSNATPVLWEQVSSLIPTGLKRHRAGVESLLMQHGNAISVELVR